MLEQDITEHIKVLKKCALIDQKVEKDFVRYVIPPAIKDFVGRKMTAEQY
jgi:hypothetical protein